MSSLLTCDSHAGTVKCTAWCDIVLALSCGMFHAHHKKFHRGLSAVCPPQVDAHPLSQIVQAAPTDAVPTWAWTFPTGGASASTSATASGEAAASASLMHERIAFTMCLLPVLPSAGQ